MLVDAHLHLNDYHEGQPVPTEENARRRFAKMDEHGVDQAIVSTNTPYVDFLSRRELSPEAREGPAWRTASDVFDLPLDAAR